MYIKYAIEGSLCPLGAHQYARNEELSNTTRKHYQHQCEVPGCGAIMALSHNTLPRVTLKGSDSRGGCQSSHRVRVNHFDSQDMPVLMSSGSIKACPPQEKTLSFSKAFCFSIGSDILRISADQMHDVSCKQLTTLEFALRTRTTLVTA